LGCQERRTNGPEAADALLLNVAAPDDALRAESCRANVLHTLPSAAMRTDALAQFLLTKRWTEVALVAGEHPSDALFAAAFRRSAEKFGLRIAAEKTWAFDADMRRNAAAEVPLFTQDLARHDVLVIADEIHDFGRYVLYNTWTPVVVAGSEGLTPVGWSAAVENWGAAQLQGRFRKAAGRDMQSEDFAAWVAVRAIGEAVTRARTTDAAAIRRFLLSPDFSLAAFKGRAVSFRAWDGQLRQPIPLVHPRALVAMAPLEGFLHQFNELDTLGLDAPESPCTRFRRPS
jgi:ABC transporter substrate binding protein (PQQ-dependent alcohol dehydrogenase system)